MQREKTIGERALESACNEADQGYRKTGDTKGWMETVKWVYEEELEKLADKENKMEAKKKETQE